MHCAVRAIEVYLVVVCRHEGVEPRSKIVEECDLSGFDDGVPRPLGEVLQSEIHKRAKGRVSLIHDKSRL